MMFEARMWRGAWRTGNRLGLAAVVAAVLGVLGAAAAPAVADPFEVTDDASYQQLLSAGTADQIVRFEYSMNPRPRLAGTIAAVAAFAERNPLASPSQLSEFAAAVDARLSAAYPQDPDLLHSSHLLGALRFDSVVTGVTALTGTDTNVGPAALDLLGMDVSASSRTQRMVEFERATAVMLANDADFGRLLVACFMNVDRSGTYHEGLSDAVAGYLRGEGIEPLPTPSQLTADHPDIAAARAAVPQTFAAFDAERAAGYTDVRAEIDGGIGEVMSDITTKIGEIGTNLAANQDVYQAAQNAGDPAVVDLLAAQHLADLQRIAAARATIDFNALLLAQSSVPDDRVQVEVTRDFSGITLQTDSTYSDISTGVQIGGSLLAFFGSAFTGDVGSAIGSLTSVVAGIVDLSAPDVPTPDEQTFDQVVQLRQQVEDLRVEMNQQFDRVFGRLDSIDHQLNIIYTEMTDSLNQLNATTHQIDGNVQQIQSALVDVRVALSRIEQNLYGALFSGFLQDYIAGADFALGYRDRTGTDLPFAGADSFNTYESLFFSWSTSFASDNTYAGPSALTLTNDAMADDVLNAVPLGVNINNLRQFPTLLALPALSSSRLVNPTIWADTAWSYAQLARENPWYFAKINQNSPSRLGDVITAGQRVQSAMNNARSQQLFDALASDYRARAAAFASAAAAAQADCISVNSVALGDLTGIDPWQDATQSILGTNVGVDLTGTPISYAGFFDFQAPGTPRQLWQLFPPQLAIALQLGAIDLSQVTFELYSCYQEDPTCSSVTLCSSLGGDEYMATLQLHVSVDGQRVATFEQTMNGQCSFCGSPCDYGDYLAGELHQTTLETFFDPVGTVNPASNISLIVSRQLLTYPALDSVTAAANAALDARRAVLSACLRQDLTQATALRDAALLLTSSQDLFDAYTSIALPESLQRSDVVHAALRGADGIGLDAVDAMFAGQYSGTINPPDGMEAALDARIDGLMAELTPTLDPSAPDQPQDSVEWALADLTDLQSSAARLCVDDAYVTPAGQQLVVDAAGGVLANDAQQPGIPITATLAAQPVNGTVSMTADGSFTYTPNPGFDGEDSFAYFSFANLAQPGNPPNIVTALPATVVVNVCAAGTCPGAGCPADLNGDGVGDVFDLLDYLSLWFAQDPGAERTGDSTIDVFDLLSYLDVWFTGC